MSQHGYASVALDILLEPGSEDIRNSTSRHIIKMRERLLITTIHLVLRNTTSNQVQNVKLAMQSILLSYLEYGDLEAGSVLAGTCLTLLWNAGDSAARQNEFTLALSWYQETAKLVYFYNNLVIVFTL